MQLFSANATIFEQQPKTILPTKVEKNTLKSCPEKLLDIADLEVLKCFNTDENILDKFYWLVNHIPDFHLWE